MNFRFLALVILSSISIHSAVYAEEKKHKDCITPEKKDDSLIEIRDKTHASLCNAVRSIDSWFGSKEEFDGQVFSGKVIVGFRQDEDTGFDPKLRIRINAQLPNMSKRFNAFIGRTDEDAFISDSKVSGIDDLSNDLQDEDASWLIGLGYSNPNSKGFETSIGARISSGIQPYARLRYRYFLQMKENQSARFTQTLFWQNDDGIGTTSNLDYGIKLSKKRLLSLGFGATYRRDTEIWDTGSSVTLYNKLSKNRSIALKSYIFGESGDKSLVNIPEYGISISYRQPFLKPWLILNTSIENRWTHEREDQPRESFAQIGMQLEMSFGKYKSDY